MAFEVPLFVGGLPAGPEMLVILLIVVLLFGANKIPKLARSTGEAMGEFKKGRQEVEQELQEMEGDITEDLDPELDDDLDDDFDTEPATESSDG